MNNPMIYGFDSGAMAATGIGWLGKFLAAAWLASAFILSATAAERVNLNFDPDWKFIKADPAGAAAPDFNDSAWATVSAPHTYNDIDTFDNWSTPGHRGEQIQWGGRTWYRKTFTLPEEYKGKRVYIEFEAARHVAEVYLNGKLLGVSKTGFIPFGFDLTPELKFGAPNVLAVMCDNRFMKDPLEGEAPKKPAAKEKKPGEKDTNVNPPVNPNLGELSARVNALIPESVDEIAADQIPWNNPHWHPAHGGLFRNVILHVVDPLHISLPLYSFLKTAGPYIYASDISENSARISLEVPIENGRATLQKAELTADIVDHEGKTVLTLRESGEVAAGGKVELKSSGALAQPNLWEPDYPYLYHVRCVLRSGGEVVDSAEMPLGIRDVHWDVKTGFHINGHHLKLHGWGQKPTDEWPGLGAAQPDWLHYFTLELMKEAGGNFVRWGHCAGGPAMINAGDELGIIAEQPGVDGESDTRGAAWKIRAAAFRDMIIYFRNNPSILIWEGGNQKVTHDHAAELRGFMDQYDPHGGRVYAHRRADKVTGEFMDIGIGTEGGQEIKTLPVVEGEYDREESPRRVWDDFSPPNFGYPEAKGQTYQLTSEQYAANQVAQYVTKLGSPAHSGGANWIFSDSTSGGRVACEMARASGEVDGVRLPKEAYYVCQTMYGSKPEVYIIGHWNYAPGVKKNVYVASNAKDVELLVNGKSLGHGKNSDHYLFTFPDVQWQPGEIKAIGSTGGKVIAETSKHTVGDPVALRLTPITAPGGLRAIGSDVALIDVEAVDAKGERCPTFQQRVDFEMSGPGIWRGGYNSGKTNSINNTFLDLECGINRVAVRTSLKPGTIIVRAKCDGLKSGEVAIPSRAVPVTAGYTMVMPLLPTAALAKSRGHEMALDDPALQPATIAQGGKYIKTLSYSGPTTGVKIETGAAAGSRIYMDRDYGFTELPPALKGADFVQAANADKLYNAVDLMEVAVKGGATVFVAHDARLPAPDWLTRQFKLTDIALIVNGQAMKVYAHRAESDESLTLGANTEDAKAKSCNMFVVLANDAAAPK